MFQCSDAVILSGYGMGNLPVDNKGLMDTIRKSLNQDKLIVVSTQCGHGTVSDIYATGRFLTEMGCILAHDMTIECIFAKLGYLIGKVSSATVSAAAAIIQINFLFSGIFNGTNQTFDEHTFAWRVDKRVPC